MTAHSVVSDEHFMHFLTNCQRELRAFVVGLTPSQADADDVLQEVNLALWKKRASYDPKQEFAGWAFGFAALEIRRYRSRSANARLWFSSEALGTLADAWTREMPFGEQRREALKSCLLKLEAEQREMITSYYGKRSTVQDLAQKYDKPTSTIYKILAKIRESLRSCIKQSLSQAQHPPRDAYS